MSEILGVGVGVGLLFLLCFVGIWRLRRSAALRWYGRPVACAYHSFVVADISFEQLSVIGLGVCRMQSLTRHDSRLENCWYVEVAAEERFAVSDMLLSQHVRVLGVRCSVYDAVLLCLADKGIAARVGRCLACRSLLEEGAADFCAVCLATFNSDREHDEDGWGNEEHGESNASEGDASEKGDEKTVAPCVSCGRLTTGVCVECGRPVCWCWLSEGTSEEIAGWWCGCQESGEGKEER